jgi:tetratricopeptide (TPR) repeat protein
MSCLRSVLGACLLAGLVASQPLDLASQLARTEALFKSGQTEAALREVRRLEQEFGPHDPTLLAKLGQLLDRNGRASEALDLYRNALNELQLAVRRDPGNEDRYLDLAEFLGIQNAANSVLLTVLEVGAKALPGSLKIRSALGAAYVLTGQTDLAEAILKKIVAGQPDYEVGYKLLGECYERSQEWDKLRALAEQFRKLNDKNSYGWYYGASADYHLLPVQGGTSLEAIQQSIERSLDLDKKEWRTWVLLGRVLVDKKQSLKAVAAFHEAARLAPQVATTHYLLATALRRLGRSEESRRAFQAFEDAQAAERARKSHGLLVEARKP